MQMRRWLASLVVLGGLTCGTANFGFAADDPAPANTTAPKATAETATPAEKLVVPSVEAPKPVVVTPVVVTDEQAKQAEEHFSAGRKLYFQGDYPGAIAKLNAAVTANPNKTAYKLLLAKSLRQTSKNDEAAKLLTEILQTNPDHVEAGLDLAELLSPQKQPDRVIAVLEPLLKYKHDYPLYHYLAEAHYQKEQLDKARGYYEEAIKLNSSLSADHYQLGNIYLSQKRFAKAAEAYEHAGALGHSSGPYHFKVASVYFNLRQYLGTISAVEVVGGQVGQIKNNMLLIDAIPGKKETFYAAGARSAIYHATKAKQLGIDVFDLKFLTANIWLNARRYAQADAIYKELVATIKPADAGLFWYYWAQTALGLEDYEGYLQRVEKAIVSKPATYKATQADAFVTVANRYHQRGDTVRYIEFLTKAVGENPLSARLHLLLGDAHWLNNERAPALRQYQLVLELEPDHAERTRLLNRIRGQDEAGTPVAAVE